MKPLFAAALVCFLGCKAPETTRTIGLHEDNMSTKVIRLPLGYRVARIDSLKDVYLIYARRNDSLFKIVSDKELSSHCVNIKSGKYYRFRLRSLLYTDLTPEEKAHSIPGLALFDTHHMGGLDYDGKGMIIKLEGDSVRDLYYAKNVIGLCFR